MTNELPVYMTRDDCMRVALEAFDLWVPGMRLRIEEAVARIPKSEIREGLWGPDALVSLLEDTIEEHMRTTSLSNPAMATVVERDRLRANPDEPRPDHD